MPPHERTPHERETLIFPDAEKAQEFKEQVSEKLQQQEGPGQHNKDAVADAVAAQFTARGEAVDMVREPWTHTPQEHEEVQQLVDIAFAQDLGAAIKVARKSPHYPRNLDLLHDVLTGELYTLVRDSKISQQPLAGWAVLIVSAVLIACLLLLLLLVTA